MREITDTEERKEKWNENIETCSDCGIGWKKIGEQCPVCYAPAEVHDEQMMSMFSSVLPKTVEPKNPVAKFLSDEIRKLYPEQNDITGMIEGAIVDMANNDPESWIWRIMTQIWRCECF